MGSSEEFQKKLTQELEKMKTLQKDLQRALSVKQTLDGQLSENEVVKEEFEYLTLDNKVYKMTGPVLIAQDLEEAKQNVEKRIMFIKSELKSNEELLKEVNIKVEKQQEILQQLQKDFSEARMKAAQKS